MKIVQLEDVFFANSGYQINIISKFFVQQGHDVTILSCELDKIPGQYTIFFGKDPEHKWDVSYEKKYGVKIIRFPIKKYVSGRTIFNNDIFEKVGELDPDIVFVHGCQTFTAMRYLRKIKKLPYPLIMDCHMLEMASRNKLKIPFEFFYRLFCTPVIKKRRISVIRTQDDDYTWKCLGIPEELTPWISFGSDTMLFYKDSDSRNKNRLEMGIDDDVFVFLYAGKLDKAKGGLFLAEAIGKSFATNKKLVFLIIGNTIGEYGKRVEEMFNRSENHIIRKPTQSYEDLAYYYQLSDVALFPRQCSLSFYDVQACGLPVIFEDNQINKDRAMHGNAFTFKAGDVDDFRRVIQKLLIYSRKEMDEISRNAISFIENGYDYRKLSKEYLKIMEKAIASSK